MTDVFLCEFCQKRISPNAKDTCQKVTGWTGRRKAGGANHIRLTSKPIALGHRFCLDMAADKADRQESLFGD